MTVIFALNSGCWLHIYRVLRTLTQIRKFVYNYQRIYHVWAKTFDEVYEWCVPKNVFWFQHVAAT